jgi:hypothetical protein
MTLPNEVEGLERGKHALLVVDSSVMLSLQRPKSHKAM